MKALIERYIREQHPDLKIGTSLFKVKPDKIFIRYIWSPKEKRDWQPAYMYVDKMAFLTWCSKMFSANTVIDLFENWK